MPTHEQLLTLALLLWLPAASFLRGVLERLTRDLCTKQQTSITVNEYDNKVLDEKYLTLNPSMTSTNQKRLSWESNVDHSLKDSAKLVELRKRLLHGNGLQKCSFHLNQFKNICLKCMQLTCATSPSVVYSIGCILDWLHT